MRSQERWRALWRSPKLVWDILVRGQYEFVYDQMPLRAERMSLAKRVNLFKAGGNLVRRKLTPWSMPLHMQFELTNYCNLRCPVCPAGTKAVQRPPLAMDVGLFGRLMEEVGPYLLTASLWAWGEPLLHPRLEEILRAARKQRVVTLLSTNGQNLDHGRVLQALANEPPDQLILAIDGLTDETHSKFRVGAKLGPILDGVRKLAEIKRERGLRKPALHMRYIVMKHNEHEVPRLEDFARRHGFEFLSVRTLLIVDSAPAHDAHRQLLPDEASLRAYRYENGLRVPRPDFTCLEPFWFPTVFSDGTLVACEQDFNAQAALGVIADKVSFADLWFSPRAAGVRKIIRDQPERLSFCRNCPYSDRPTTDSSICLHRLLPGLPSSGFGSSPEGPERS